MEKTIFKITSFFLMIVFLLPMYGCKIKNSDTVRCMAIFEDVEVKLETNKIHYKENESIHVAASLKYIGDDDAIIVTGGSQILLIGIHSIDTEFNYGSVTTLDIREHILSSGEAYIVILDGSGFLDKASYNTIRFSEDYNSFYLKKGVYDVQVSTAFKMNGESIRHSLQQRLYVR